MPGGTVAWFSASEERRGNDDMRGFSRRRRKAQGGRARFSRLRADCCSKGACRRHLWRCALLCAPAPPALPPPGRRRKASRVARASLGAPARGIQPGEGNNRCWFKEHARTVGAGGLRRGRFTGFGCAPARGMQPGEGNNRCWLKGHARTVGAGGLRRGRFTGFGCAPAGGPAPCPQDSLRDRVAQGSSRAARISASESCLAHAGS